MFEKYCNDTICRVEKEKKMRRSSNVEISGEYYEIGERILRIGSVSEPYMEKSEECECKAEILEGTKRAKLKNK